MTRAPPLRPTFRTTYEWSPERDAKLIRLYEDNDWTWEEVGQIIGVSRSAAYHRGVALGVRMRPKGRIRGMAYENCSFDQVTRMVDGKPGTFAQFKCKGCGTTLDLSMTGHGSLAPEGYSKQAALKGWLAHPMKRARVFCPTCAASRPINDPDSELKKMSVTSLPTPPSVPREITTKERLQIRDMLDKSFDDDVGCYLDDMSDEAVASKLNVPRIFVERVREAAYGPIRVDPVMVALRAEIAQAKRDLEAVKTAASKLEAMLMGLSSRIEKKVAGK